MTQRRTRINRPEQTFALVGYRPSRHFGAPLGQGQQRAEAVADFAELVDCPRPSARVRSSLTSVHFAAVAVLRRSDTNGSCFAGSRLSCPDVARGRWTCIVNPRQGVNCGSTGCPFTSAAPSFTSIRMHRIGCATRTAAYARRRAAAVVPLARWTEQGSGQEQGVNGGQLLGLGRILSVHAETSSTCPATPVRACA